MVEDDGAGAGGALVNGDYVLVHGDVLVWMACGYWSADEGN
jgi:hypothetical protein